MSNFSGRIGTKPAPATATPKRGSKAKQQESPAAVPAAPASGRALGKRVNPDYLQTTTYVRRAILEDVKIKLLQERAGRDFSELVNQLLADWLKARS
jgi:hypothetical protein